jgi:hypothetical protein
MRKGRSSRAALLVDNRLESGLVRPFTSGPDNNSPLLIHVGEALLLFPLDASYVS